MLIPNKFPLGKGDDDALSSSTYASSMVPGDSIYHRQDLCTVITEILKVAIPCVISSTLGQLVYLINFV